MMVGSQSKPLRSLAQDLGDPCVIPLLRLLVIVSGTFLRHLPVIVLRSVRNHIALSRAIACFNFQLKSFAIVGIGFDL